MVPGLIPRPYVVWVIGIALIPVVPVVGRHVAIGSSPLRVKTLLHLLFLRVSFLFHLQDVCFAHSGRRVKLQ